MLEVKPFSPRERRFRELVDRAAPLRPDAVAAVGASLEKIRVQGLHGVTELCREQAADFDPDRLHYSPDELDQAHHDVDGDFLTAFSLARVNIRKFHEHQRRRGYFHEEAGTLRLERRVRPLRRVAICPGASVLELLHYAVPAQVAGVGEIVVAAGPGGSGRPNTRVLAAARVLGIDEVVRLDGAIAVGALAYGCDGLRPVDKIVGRGDGVMTDAAKAGVRHRVGVDEGRSGRGELAVLADAAGKARFIAHDLLGTARSAEDGGLMVLIALDRFLAEAVRIELANAAEKIPNGPALLDRIDRFGGLYHCPDLDGAIRAINALAPARLSVATRDNAFVLADIETAGLVTVGPWPVEAAGLAFAGATMPVGVDGSSAFTSGAGVEDFVREFSVVEYSPEYLLKTGRHQAILSRADGSAPGLEALEERLALLKLAVE
ncbi:MAG: histidinol dehydrogenase [Planctomycetes bacterium]|nr:histidinol dehydrogenase [Planctomycetota bacterium]